MTTTSARPRARGMAPSLTILFAIAGGAAVGNLYWAQPLLGTIAHTFDVSIGSAGLVVTVTQIGYAVGCSSSCHRAKSSTGDGSSRS